MRKSKILNQDLNHFIFFSLSIVMFCCQGEDLSVDPSDPSAISRAIHIPQSTRLSTDFPDPSSVPLAPVLEVDTDSIFMIGTSYKNIFLSLKSGNAKGFFIKVKDAGEYFKITSTSAVINHQGGNILAFGFRIENDIEGGSFKIMYSVYDEENRVSNIVERTVIITEVPGKDSQFLSGTKWHLKQIISTANDPNDTIFAGVSEIFQYSTKLDCYGPPDKHVDVMNEYGINSLYALSEEGKISITSNYYTKTFDELGSKNSCSLQYNQEQSISRFEGKWSYYSEAKRLILIYNRFEIDAKGVKTIYDDEIREYAVVMLDDNILMWKPTDENQETVVLK